MEPGEVEAFASFARRRPIREPDLASVPVIGAAKSGGCRLAGGRDRAG